MILLDSVLSSVCLLRLCYGATHSSHFSPQKVAELGLMPIPPSPSRLQVQAMYQAAMAAGAINIPSLSPKGRKRRVESLKWTTLAKHARLEAAAANGTGRPSC